jgi:hypothetical protein
MAWYTLLLALWLLCALALTFWFKYQIFEFLWCILHSVPLLRWMTRPIIALILFPWVFLHELSHAIIGRMGGNRIHKISVYPETVIQNGHTQIVLGYTSLEGGNPMYSGLSKIAPLFLGNLAVALLLHFGFGIRWLHMLDYPQTVLGAFLEVIIAIVSRKSFLLVFLLFAFGNGAIPSSSDWELHGIVWIATVSILVIVLSVIAAVGFDAVTEPYHMIKLLALFTMLAIQLTVVLIIDVLTYTILLFPGKWAVERYGLRD